MIENPRQAFSCSLPRIDLDEDLVATQNTRKVHPPLFIRFQLRYTALVKDTIRHAQISIYEPIQLLPGRSSLGFKILKKQVLAPNTVLFDVEAPQIAAKAKAGQFIILRVCDNGERIPLTIAQTRPADNVVTIVVQELGKTTFDLCRLNEGEEILDFVGPLGKPTEISNVGTVVCVGGGVGNAVVWAMVQGFKAAGNKLISIIGAREKELLILEDEIGAISDELIVTTDDGSYGRKGLVTEALKEVLDREDEKVSEVVTIGPVIMMKFVAKTTEPYGVPTQASLNPIMVDGTGMCGACRVTVGGKIKFACVDGPEFDAHKVDFDELMSRLVFYKDMETESYERARNEKCRLMQQAEEVE
ncbi:MAG: sulfide/dihydroorotate dehydrogenase-like FAD/NAD-binding protein [bacterium]|nr:sulfide/dihydroorotate dehydrogenase-like FAD/NAD-binding protein [bacterium]